MTVTTTTVGTSPTRRFLEHLRRGVLSIHAMRAAIAARWRAEVAAGSFGPDTEAIIGRGTGARV